MVEQIIMSDQECLYALEHNEFSPNIINASENVAVVMSQDWCPQWRQMESYLGSSAGNGDISVSVFVILYNQKKFFEPFMEMKEQAWGNDLIPYVRYYKKGKLIAQSNYVWQDKFINTFL